MIEWGKKSKPQKIANKTQKNLWTKNEPPKNPIPEFGCTLGTHHKKSEGGVVQKQNKNLCKAQIEKKNSCIAKEPEKKYPARTTDETVYTYYTVCEKHNCSRKFPPLLPPTTLPVIPIKSPPKVPSGVSFHFF